MSPYEFVTNLPARRVLAWATLIAIALLFALALQALAANVLRDPASTASTVCHAQANAALADGDDVRARFLAQLCG
jgi:hypothetical protein